jgi:hypothetical protein
MQLEIFEIDCKGHRITLSSFLGGWWGSSRRGLVFFGCSLNPRFEKDLLRPGHSQIHEWEEGIESRDGFRFAIRRLRRG